MAYLTAEDIEEIKKKKKKKQSSVNTPKYLTNKDVEEILNRKNNVNTIIPSTSNVLKQKEQEVIKQRQKEIQTKTAFNTELNKKGVLTTGSTTNFSAPNLFTVANEQRKTIENGKLPTYQEIKMQKQKAQENIAKYEDIVKTNPKYQEFKTEFYKTPQVEYEYDVERVKNQSITKSDKVFSGFKSGLTSSLLPRRVTQDENGNYVSLDNYYQLKNRKVYDNSTSKAGRLYNTATQAIGNMVPSIVLGGVAGGAAKAAGAAVKGVKAARKIGSLGTLFVTAARDSTNQKLLDGYTKQEANQYGLMSSAIETATELLFGGMGKVFGTGALDDVVTKKLIKGIKNKVLKTLGEAGISSVGEGIEEVIGNLLYPIADKIALNSDKSYSELLKDQNMTQDFLSAIISSAILSAPSSVVSYRNNINNENQPLESDTQTNVLDNTNRLEKQEDVLNGSKIANNDILPINENIKKEIPTAEDVIRTKKENQITKRYNKMLEEDLKVAAKEAITPATNNVAAPQNNVFRKIEQDRPGLKIIESNSVVGNGLYVKTQDGSRIITINPNSPKATEFVLIHELAHDLSGTPEYNELKQTILNYDKGITGFEEARANLTAMYKDIYTQQIKQNNPNISQQELNVELNKIVEEEATNDVLGTMLSDQNYINKLSMEKPNVFQKVYRWVSDMLKRVSGKESKFLQDIKKKFENAYKQPNVSKVGEMLSVEQDYMMYHRPTEGPQAFDLLQENEEISGPKDIYENPQYYTGTLNKQELQETMSALQNARANPNAQIKIYRATTGNKINNGDWVTLSKSYANTHNESQLDGKGNILEKIVFAKDIRWALDDLAEWGYFPTEEQKYSKSTQGKWQERLNTEYEPKGIQNKKQTVKPFPTKEDLTKIVTPLQTQPFGIPTIEDIAKIKKVKEFEAPKIIQSSLDANEKYVLNTQDKVKRVGMTKDFYRNMRNLFDKKTADKVTGEFDEAKLNNVKLSNELANDLKENVVNKYNIQKGSKDSALIQKYGEGLIGEADLKKESPNNWQNIIEADKYFRKQYDMLIDKINASRKTIYPNVEKTIIEYENKIQDTTQKIISKQSELKATKKDTVKYTNLKNQINSLHLKKQSYIATIESDEILRNKRVEKRQDYYRHFQEMAEGFNALRNILSTSSDIAPKMVGTSDFTKPNAKFSSITQRRTGNKTKYDAIGGLLDYIPTASFMINIDPQIYKFRKMTNDIKDQMGKETYANQAIQFMTEWTNGLAGKQNYIDRATQKTLDSLTWGQGRKAIKGLNWLSGRIKSNMILGNMSSTLSQSLNLPQVVGKVKNPKLLMQGLADTFNPNTDYSQSQFIMERYKSDIKSQFDTKLIEQPKKLAVWMLGALDQAVTKTGWNALYRQAIEKNIPNPIQYADNNIRDLVAGRGIGEKTIFQESKVIGTLMPFTVEVGNLNRVLKDFAREKDVAGLFILFIVANLLNKGIEKIGGSGKTFDPIEALKEALTEEDITVLERIGRVGGEVLSNIPIGQQIAALYPEYGNKDLGLPTRDKLFGDNDPTRFGTGSMYSKIGKDPITTLITPWGGTQIKRTTDALKMYDKDLPGSYTDSGKLRFPVKDDKLTKVQAALFGQYASKEAREYFDKNRRPLSKNQAEEVKNSKNWKEAYNLILKQREYDALGRKYEKYVKEGKSTKELQKEIDNFWK